jgi:hypothetical protein
LDQTFQLKSQIQFGQRGPIATKRPVQVTSYLSPPILNYANTRILNEDETLVRQDDMHGERHSYSLSLFEGYLRDSGATAAKSKCDGFFQILGKFSKDMAKFFVDGGVKV